MGTSTVCTCPLCVVLLMLTLQPLSVEPVGVTTGPAVARHPENVAEGGVSVGPRFVSTGFSTVTLPLLAASPTSKNENDTDLPAAAGITRIRLKVEVAPEALAKMGIRSHPATDTEVLSADAPTTWARIPNELSPRPTS